MFSLLNRNKEKLEHPTYLLGAGLSPKKARKGGRFRAPEKDLPNFSSFQKTGPCAGHLISCFCQHVSPRILFISRHILDPVMAGDHHKGSEADPAESLF